MIDIEREDRMEQNQILPVCIVAGNKCDLQGIRQIAARDGLEWSRQHNFGFMETSAREMVNIEETFARMLSGLSVQVPFTDLEQSSSAAWWKRERMQQLAYRKSSHSQLHEAALPRPVIAPSTRRDLRPWTLSRRNCLHRLNRSGTHHLSAAKSVHVSLYDFRSWLEIPDWKSILTYCFVFTRSSDAYFGATLGYWKGLDWPDIGYTLYFREGVCFTTPCGNLDLQSMDVYMYA
jgi:hypothetical protein